MSSGGKGLMGTLLIGVAVLIAPVATAQAQVGLAAAGKATTAKVKTLGSYKRLGGLAAAGPLRRGGCKRSRTGRARCTVYRTAYRPCLASSDEQPACRPLTRTWKATVAASRSGKARVVRIRSVDRSGYAGPCAGGPCVNGKQVSGGASVEDAARAAVLSDASYVEIDPADPSGSRLITHSCSAVGTGRSECLLLRAVATPCQLKGETEPGTVCTMQLVYRNWVASVIQDPQSPSLFTATVLRYWDAGQPPAM